MKNELFPYQKIGAEWLASQKTCLLGDEPRLGKAVQSITAIDMVKGSTALIVCRGVARANWADEFARWSPRKWECQIIYGKKFELKRKHHDRPYAVITSYECLEEVLKKAPDNSFSVGIIDEAHYAKTIDAKRTKLIFGKGNLPAKARRLFALTGTPMPNGLASELWVLLYAFGATKLSYWDFAKRFCIVKDTGYGTVITGTNQDPALLQELQALMKPKVLRRTAAEVSVQLPKMSFSTVMVPPGRVDLGSTSFWKYTIPTDRTAELAAAIEAELGIMNGILDGASGPTFSHEVLETLKAQAKSISTLRRYTALQKLDPACELIREELEANAYSKCVIFAHHRDCILGAAQRLYKFFPVCMYGGTSPARLEKNLKNFQNPKHKTRVFIGQISAAGTSISLSAANHIFFLEESFVPGDNMQAAQRCGGVNQPKPIFVRTFCLENSVDQRVQTILREKMNAMAKIYGSPAAPAPTNELPEDMI